MLDERNELLAKLMATEDIDVQQNNVPTAYFDTKKRVLVLPNWKNLSQMETEMLIGHEIGHALYTPTNAWVAAIESFDGNKEVFKHVMNVVEDPRIERGVKKKYPGMRKIFYFGYEELFQRGLFTEDLDPSKLTLIDKLNFQFKIPGKVQFDTDEKFWELVQKIESCETFPQVVALSKEIYALCEEENQQTQQSESVSSEESEWSEEGSEGQPSEFKDSDPSADKREGKGSEDSGSQKQESESSEGSSSKEFAEKYTPTIQKKLDEFLLKNQEGARYNYMELPEPILENILITNKELQKFLSEYEWAGDSPTKYPKYDSYLNESSVDKEEEEEDEDEVEAVDLSSIAASIKKFNKDYSASIAYYTKVFDMKKKATEYKNTLQFKTGKLDMNSLTKYKFEDNIFLTTQVKQKGKNHGIVFYLDMSSSMQKIFKQTLIQLLEVVSFCRSCGIPVSVYGFTDNSSVVNYLHVRAGAKRDGYYGKGSTLEQFKNINDKNPWGSTFGLIEIFTPSMTNKEFVHTFELFLSNKWRHIYWFNLNGTPLAPAINTLESIVNRFRKTTRAEIVNVVFLTDGGDTHGGNFYDITYSGVIYDKKKKNRVTSDYLKKKYEGTWMSRNGSYMVPGAILNLMKKRLQGVSVVNFFINNWAGNSLYSVEKKATMEFDEMYIVHPDAFKKEGSLSSSYCANVEDLTNKFTQLSKKKQMKRTMINSFIEKIAK
jgi:hypothetical protein